MDRIPLCLPSVSAVVLRWRRSDGARAEVHHPWATRGLGAHLAPCHGSGDAKAQPGGGRCPNRPEDWSKDQWRCPGDSKLGVVTYLFGGTGVEHSENRGRFIPEFRNISWFTVPSDASRGTVSLDDRSPNQPEGTLLVGLQGCRVWLGFGLALPIRTLVRHGTIYV